MDFPSFLRLLKRVVRGCLKALAVWRAIKWLIDYFFG